MENASRRPKGRHPNAHTAAEIAQIEQYLLQRPKLCIMEIYGKMRQEYGYRRHFASLWRVCKRLQERGKSVKREQKEWKKYHTAKGYGEKMQVDVLHYVRGRRCYYQYTMLDEATRMRYLHLYRRRSARETVHFLKKAIAYFGVQPKEIQTDNGREFVNAKVAEFCQKREIVCKQIKWRTPRHNGKVERSHRNDRERFYRQLEGERYSFEKLQKELAKYVERSNQIPMRVLRGEKGELLSPKEYCMRLMGAKNLV